MPMEYDSSKILVIWEEKVIGLGNLKMFNIMNLWKMRGIAAFFVTLFCNWTTDLHRRQRRNYRNDTKKMGYQA